VHFRLRPLRDLRHGVADALRATAGEGVGAKLGGKMATSE